VTVVVLHEESFAGALRSEELVAAVRAEGSWLCWDEGGRCRTIHSLGDVGQVDVAAFCTESEASHVIAINL